MLLVYFGKSVNLTLHSFNSQIAQIQNNRLKEKVTSCQLSDQRLCHLTQSDILSPYKGPCVAPSTLVPSPGTPPSGLPTPGDWPSVPSSFQPMYSPWDPLPAVLFPQYHRVHSWSRTSYVICWAQYKMKCL